MAETETVLLRRFAREGDAEAFAEIVRRHAGLVYGVALRILADVDRASDVAQETFLQLTKDAGAVTGSLGGWLHRVATHKAIDVIRRDKSRHQREVAYTETVAREVATWKDLSSHIDEALNDLEPELREILVDHFLESHTTRDIAKARGISQATVSRRVEAGVGAMRGILHRRGLIVAAGALGTLMADNTVKGAPAMLMTELGKMAIVGGQTVAASAASTATASTATEVAAGTVLAAVKSKALVVATVAIIGTGSVVTYQHAAKTPDESPPITATQAAPEPMQTASGPTTVVVDTPPATTERAEIVPWWQQAAADSQTADTDRDTTASSDTTEEQAEPVASADETGRRPTGGMMGGGMGGGMMMGGRRPTPAESDDDEQPAEGGPGRGMGGGMMGGDFYEYRYRYGPGEPNDANQP
jgi:RNA polymerase sigma factor (sigma-70 family)